MVRGRDTPAKARRRSAQSTAALETAAILRPTSREEVWGLDESGGLPFATTVRNAVRRVAARALLAVLHAARLAATVRHAEGRGAAGGAQAALERAPPPAAVRDA